jgi:hypothetical protein
MRSFTNILALFFSFFLLGCGDVPVDVTYVAPDTAQPEETPSPEIKQPETQVRSSGTTAPVSTVGNVSTTGKKETEEKTKNKETPEAEVETLVEAETPPQVVETPQEVPVEIVETPPPETESSLNLMRCSGSGYYSTILSNPGRWTGFTNSHDTATDTYLDIWCDEGKPRFCLSSQSDCPWRNGVRGVAETCSHDGLAGADFVQFTTYEGLEGRKLMCSPEGVAALN